MSGSQASRGTAVDRSPGRLTRVGFTLVEVLVVVSILALLVSLLLPSLNKARQAAKLAVCSSNLRQIGTGVINYASDSDGHFPSHWYKPSSADLSKYAYIFQDWGLSTRFHRDYMGSAKRDVFFCPASLDQVLSEPASTDQRVKTYYNWPDPPGGGYAEITYGYFAGNDERMEHRPNNRNRRQGPISLDRVARPSHSTMVADVARFDARETVYIKATHWNHNDGPWKNPPTVSDEANVHCGYVDGHVASIAGEASFRKHSQAPAGNLDSSWVHEQPHD